jgi:hypothetical protein
VIVIRDLPLEEVKFLLGEHGFKVYEDGLGLWIPLDGEPHLFTKGSLKVFLNGVIQGKKKCSEMI